MTRQLPFCYIQYSSISDSCARALKLQIVRFRREREFSSPGASLAWNETDTVVSWTSGAPCRPCDRPGAAACRRCLDSTAASHRGTSPPKDDGPAPHYLAPTGSGSRSPPGVECGQLRRSQGQSLFESAGPAAPDPTSALEGEFLRILWTKARAFNIGFLKGQNSDEWT